MTSPGGIIPGANQMVNSGKVRMIGCQMPCTNSLETNVKNIKAAIDKSQEIITQVDKARRASIHEAKEKYLPYIITPEGCLSGYDPHFDDYFDEILDAEKELTQSESNLVNAQYQLIISSFNLLKDLSITCGLIQSYVSI